MKVANALSHILLSMKKQYGISQTSVAGILGVSVQALTDMKSGRRVFTPAMAEKLFEHCKNEPWADWLAHELKELAAPNERMIFPARDCETLLTETVVHWGARPTVPLLKMPQLGLRAPVNEHYDYFIELPEWAISLITVDSNPYVLELATDDYSGRLRAGDCVLVLQIVIPNKEVMVVEQDGCLCLARNALHTDIAKDVTAGWIALDSGVMLKNAVPVSTVIGIVSAIM